MTKKNYQVIKEGNRYTIAEWDEGYKAFIINDGIFQSYYWDTEIEAQNAAEKYNNYQGCEWLAQHGYGNDKIYKSEIKEYDKEMIALYEAFNAIIDDSE